MEVYISQHGLKLQNATGYYLNILDHKAYMLSRGEENK